MSLPACFSEILGADIPAAFEMFGRKLDAEWIDEALEKTGKASVRRRKISAQLVVWLAIGMAMFRDRSVQEVVSHLGLVLPSEKSSKKPSAGRSVAPSAIPQARYRVGASPLEEIFRRTATVWSCAAADELRWRGLSLYGVDGTVLRVPDTEENREAFGLPGSGRAQAGYPQVRLVALMALRSHLISAVAYGPCKGKMTGENTLAKQLWRQLPDDSLVILDKGFSSFGQLYRLSQNEDGTSNGKHWMIRAKSNLRSKTVKVLGYGDELVEINISSQARKEDPTLPKKMVVRAIRYQVKGYRPQTLLTSMVDPDQFPATEMAALYHERWELEIGYDEAKTHMLERQEALRSKKAEGVRQEIWGILLAYNLIRKEMLEVADAAGVPPVRISFRHALMLIRVFCTVEAWACAPGNLPKRLVSFHDTLKSLLILPERRPDRRYKRHVKIKMSTFKRNPGKPASKGAK